MCIRDSARSLRARLPFAVPEHVGVLLAGFVRRAWCDDDGGRASPVPSVLVRRSQCQNRSSSRFCRGESNEHGIAGCSGRGGCSKAGFRALLWLLLLRCCWCVACVSTLALGPWSSGVGVRGHAAV
eukprot:10169283-Alexandrium_andersonii.AAC.1